MNPSRRYILVGTQSLLLLGLALRSSRWALAQDCKNVDPNTTCVQVGASTPGIADTSSSDTGSIGDGDSVPTGNGDDDSSNSDYESNPTGVEDQVAADVASINETAIDLSEHCTNVAVALAIAAILCPEAEIALAVTGIAFDLLGSAFSGATHDPPISKTKVMVFHPPTTRQNFSGGPLNAAAQQLGLSCTSMVLGLTAYATTHNRYSGAVARATATPTVSNVEAVIIQARALAANATTLSTVSSKFAADLSTLSQALRTQKVTLPKSLTTKAAAAAIQRNLPSIRTNFVTYYHYGPQSTITVLTTANRFIGQLASINTAKIAVGDKTFSFSTPHVSVQQVVATLNATASEQRALNVGLLRLAQTIGTAKWPSPAASPHPPSCPPGQTMVLGKCVRGSPQ